MADWISNQCGGARWRTLPNWIVEVEGQGTPAYEPGSSAYENLSRTWSNWSGLFRSAASRYGIAVSWVVAIATNETGSLATDAARQASVISFDEGVGIMQITRYPGTTVAEMQDPRANVLTGARILRDKSDRYGAELPYVAAGYNAGGVYCSPGNNEWNFRSTGDYSGRAVRFNNSAILYLGVNSGSLLATMTQGALAAAVVGSAYVYWRKRAR